MLFVPCFSTCLHLTTYSGAEWFCGCLLRHQLFRFKFTHITFLIKVYCNAEVLYFPHIWGKLQSEIIALSCCMVTFPQKLHVRPYSWCNRQNALKSHNSFATILFMMSRKFVGDINFTVKSLHFHTNVNRSQPLVLESPGKIGKLVQQH